MDENDKIRERILFLLEKKGLRVADVVREAKVSHSGLREFLIGKNQSASISFLSKICAVLGVSIVDLLTNDSVPPPPPRIDAPESEEMLALMQELTSDERKKLLDMGKAFKYGYTGNKKAS